MVNENVQITMLYCYLNEEPILKNVKTWRCSEKKSLNYVLNNLSKLVVKEVHGSGGYGILIGPTSSKKEIKEFKKKLLAQPSNYIAQPTLSLSVQALNIFGEYSVEKKLGASHLIIVSTSTNATLS